MVHLNPFQRKEADWCPFMSRDSPVTPNGLTAVTLTSLFDTPGWRIETLEPVFTIRRLDTPSISNETVGVPCSNIILDRESLDSHFRGAEVKGAVFTPYSRFPEC